MTDEGFLKYLDEQFLDKTSIQLHNAIGGYYKDQRINKPTMDDIIALVKSTKKYIVERAAVTGNLTISKNPDYKEATERDKEVEELNYKKLKLDIKISERIVKTYTWTQIIAWVSFIVALFLGWLQLAQVLKLWPYHK